MRRRALLLAFFFSVPLLLTPALLAKDKPKTGTSDKIRQDFNKSVDTPGAPPVGADTCTTCHSDIAANFRHAFHAQQGLDGESCHGPGRLHVQGGGDVSKIISFRKRSANDANGVCLSCHAQEAKIRNWT